MTLRRTRLFGTGFFLFQVQGQQRVVVEAHFVTTASSILIRLPDDLGHHGLNKVRQGLPIIGLKKIRELLEQGDHIVFLRALAKQISPLLLQILQVAFKGLPLVLMLFQTVLEAAEYLPAFGLDGIHQRRDFRPDFPQLFHDAFDGLVEFLDLVIGNGPSFHQQVLQN